MICGKEFQYFFAIKHTIQKVEESSGYQSHWHSFLAAMEEIQKGDLRRTVFLGWQDKDC